MTLFDFPVKYKPDIPRNIMVGPCSHRFVWPLHSVHPMTYTLTGVVSTRSTKFQFWLPNEKKWLAVGSFNNHLDVLVNKYNIKSKKKLIHSGCLGWGYERLIYAVISQGKNLNK